MRVNAIICIAATTVLGAAAAAAAEVSYDFVACNHSKRNTLEETADLVAYGVETWGTVASSKTPEWENASTRCVGYVRVVGGAPYGKGTCKWIIASGDAALGEFEFDQAGSKFTWLSGTGRLKGIQGSGSFKFMGEARPVEPGTSQSCRHDWGSYRLPG